MRSRPLLWFLLSLLCLAGAFYFWKLGDEWAGKPPTPVPQAVPMQTSSPAASAAASTSAPPTLPIQAQMAGTRATNWLAYRLRNTAKTPGQLERDQRAILLENADIDTGVPLELDIPGHLRSALDPGSYIVQARGQINDAFRARLAQAGARIVSYIPNNAYLVRVSAAGSRQLSADVQTQSVLPFEPAYKLKADLLRMGMLDEPLPPGVTLNVMVFADAREAVIAELESQGAEILAESRSPFGPVLTVQPVAERWVEIARLPGVQVMERIRERVPANDRSRAWLRVSADTQAATNYLNLTGSNVVVSVNDTGVDARHPDLTNRVFGDFPTSLVDSNGHGTHVAGIIAGSGVVSATVTTNVQGSLMPSVAGQFRGKAPGAQIFSVARPVGGGLVQSDEYLQEVPARTNWEVFSRSLPLISNNSWNYAFDNSYGLAAASYDAAVRDTLPGMIGSQPGVFVFPAGNGGNGNHAGLSGTAGSILSPGTAKNVITVGAIEQARGITNEVVLDFDSCTTTNINGTNVLLCATNQPWATMTDSDRQVASFSSRGNVGIGIEGASGRFKPDVVAPGTFVISTRSTQWDQAAYYSPEFHLLSTNRGLLIPAGSFFTNSVFLLANTFRLTISLGTNVNSPTNLSLPIFVNPSGPADPSSPVFTNSFSSPPDLPLAPVEASWSYLIGNPYSQTVSFDLVTDIVLTNDNGNYFQVLSNLNSALDTNGFYRYEGGASLPPNGTSMAAAGVSGTLALIQDFFTNNWAQMGIVPSPALLKAMLINGARSVNTLDEYDFNVGRSRNHQGWGLINLPNSLPVAVSNLIPGVTHAGPASLQIFDQNPTNALATGQSHTRLVNVSDFGRLVPLRFTLVWTDPPGNPVAGKKLVNDLNLVVTNLDSREVFVGNNIPPGSVFNLPWDPSDTNAAPPVADAVNNVENVYLLPNLASNYSVTVYATNVNVNALSAHPDNVAQDYALVISSGDGEVTNALTLASPPIPAIVSLDTRNVTGVGLEKTNETIAGTMLLEQRVGANTPLLGTSDGITNQWHFYVITNTTSFTNAAFGTFQPRNLSIPRIGVREGDVLNATREEADIDMYVSTNAAMTNLSPAVVAAADKSLGRGGTELVAFSSLTSPGTVYYVGVKSEDQMAAEYTFLAVFSLNPFNGPNPPVFGGPAAVPDGIPAVPGVTNFVAISTGNFRVRRVVITNSLGTEDLGDLAGYVFKESKFAVLNNHRVVPAGDYAFVYADQDEGDIPGAMHTDGPGSLGEFVGEDVNGLWVFEFADDALTQTSTVYSVSMYIEPSSINDDQGVIATVRSNSWWFDSIDVPADAASLTVCVTSNTLPVDLYLRRGDFPSQTVYDSVLVVDPPGGCLTLARPPLEPGRYYIGVYNPNAVDQTVHIRARVTRSLSSISSVVSSTVTNIALLDDAITNASMFVSDNLVISSMDVGLLIRHPRISDLAITLVSPSGTRVLLFEDRGMTSPDGLGGMGTFLEVTNMTPFYTNSFERSPIGPYAPGAVFEGWNVLSNMVRVYHDFSVPALTNRFLGLGDGTVSNTLPTTASTAYALSFRATHAPYLVGTVGWWPLDEDGRDIFGGFDGLLCGDVIFAGGKVNQAYYGDGVATSMIVPRCSDLDVGRGRGLSIEGWIRPENVTNSAPLVEWYDATNSFPAGVQFWLAGGFTAGGGPGSLSAAIWDTNASPHFIETLPNAVTNAGFIFTNGWQHVALTYDKDSGVANLYVNGVLSQTAALGSFTPRTWGDLYFGFHPTNSPFVSCFAGGMDEFGLYDRALSGCEISNIFNAVASGKYGTNVLSCPVSVEVTLPTVPGSPFAFVNGLTWTNGPQWEVNTITNISLAAPTNRLPIILRALDPNVVVDEFVLSALATNRSEGLMHFTEDTNLAAGLIKFAPRPFIVSNFPPVLIFSNHFEKVTPRIYGMGDILPGSDNDPLVGVRDWIVTGGPLTVVSNASFDIQGTNWVALARGAVACELPTSPGHRYELSYAVRGPAAVGWWNGELEPLSQRAHDLIGENHGAFINGATNATGALVGARALYFEGLITNDIATKIELGDAGNLRLTNGITIEGWVRSIAPTNYFGEEMLFFRGDSRQCRDPFFLSVSPTNGVGGRTVRFHVEDASGFGCGVDLGTTNSPITLDAWCHVAAVFESDVFWMTNAPHSTNGMWLYVHDQNGNLVSSNSLYTGLRPFAELDPAYSPGVALGNRSRYDYSQPFRGYLDEWSVYGRALTPPEVRAIAAGGSAGKADFSVPPASSLAQARVSLDGAEMATHQGENGQWGLRTVTFTAVRTNTVLTLESLLPGTIIDSVTLTEVPAELFYLPEESLAAFAGENAFGEWRLELWDTRAGAASGNPELVEWQLNFHRLPNNSSPVVDLSHCISYSNSLVAGGIQYFVVEVPQWATQATNILEFAVQSGTVNPQPVSVLFNPTNFPTPTDLAIIGPATSGTALLTTNGLPPLVIGQPYYLAVSNPNPVPVTFSLAVCFDILTLPNCEVVSNLVVWPAGIPRYLQFDVPTNGPAPTPAEVTFRLTGAQSNLTVVLSQHLPLPTLSDYDYISERPCTNDEFFVVLTNTTPFPVQTNRWYVGIYNSRETNVAFVAETCYTNFYPELIPLTNGVPFQAALASRYVAPPGPPKWFFFEFEITDPLVGAVLFELYGLSGEASLVLQRDHPPGLTPYFDGSFRQRTDPEQIVVRAGPELPDLTGKWYAGIHNHELTNDLAYTIRAVVPANGLLVSAQPIVIGISLLSPASRGLLLQWNSVEGERYVVEFAPSLTPPVTWTPIGSVVATTPCSTFVAPISFAGIGFYRIVQSPPAPPPPLLLTIQNWPGNQVRISWPIEYPAAVLQSSPSLAGPWMDVGLPVAVEGNEFVVYDVVTGDAKFYRLR